MTPSTMPTLTMSEHETCLQCGKPVPDFEYTYCCSSYDCGCGGRPIEPCICSEECWESFMSPNRHEPTRS